jgi:hypothetical protein
MIPMNEAAEYEPQKGVLTGQNEESFHVQLQVSGAKHDEDDRGAQKVVAEGKRKRDETGDSCNEYNEQHAKEDGKDQHLEGAASDFLLPCPYDMLDPSSAPIAGKEPPPKWFLSNLLHPMETRFVEVDGVKINYLLWKPLKPLRTHIESEVQPPTLIFLHGI